MQYTASVFLQTKGFALCDTESYRGPCHRMVMGESPGASFLRPSDRSAIWWSCDRGPVFLLCCRQPDTWWECAGERCGRGCQIVNTNTCSEVPCCLVLLLSLPVLLFNRASLVTQLVKNPPALQETPVWFLGQEDPLEKGYATHSRILGLPLCLSW